MDKRILFVVPWLPYPFTSGGHQAVFNGIRAVAGYAEIIVTYYEDEGHADPRDMEAFRKGIGGNVVVEPFYKPVHTPVPQEEHTSCLLRLYRFFKRRKASAKRWIRNLAGINDRQTVQVKEEKPYSGWYKQFLPIDHEYGCHIRNLIRTYDIDIVQCEMFRCAPAVYYIPHGVRKIFVHHELRAERFCLERDASGEQSLEYDAYLAYLRANEVSLINLYDAVITLSEVDRKKLVRDGVTAEVYGSMAIVNTPAELLPAAQEPGFELSFIGKDTHSPNVDGLMWFLDNCWGLLLDKEPSYHLTVIGKWSSSFVEEVEAGYANVSFSGYVDDLSGCIRNTVMIVPVRIGSGIRMKILEAASVGAPVVSTTIGAEGLPMRNGEHLFIADSPEEFVDSIIKLQDRDIRTRFVRNANEIVKRHYSFDVFRNNRLAIYDSICRTQQ